MNKWGKGLLDTGSPFFNLFIGLRLYPFDDVAIQHLFQRAKDDLGPVEIKFIRCIAGPHPFLLQAAAATWLETGGKNQPEVAASQFYERVTSHFDDLWDTLDDGTRTTAVILCLVEMGGRALGQEFNYGGIAKVEAFTPQLNQLAERGLAEKVGKGWQFDLNSLLLWRGERWAISSRAFTWWVRDVVINRVRAVPSYDDWLAKKRYKMFLTQETWDKLTSTAHKVPKWTGCTVGEIASSLFKALLGKD